MKTSSNDVLCDGCGAVIPAMHPTALFVTLRGPQVGHRKADLCGDACLVKWAQIRVDRTLGEAKLIEMGFLRGAGERGPE